MRRECDGLSEPIMPVLHSRKKEIALLSCIVNVALIFYMRAVIAPLGRASDAVGREDAKSAASAQ